jgi:hypothetical protein
MCCREMGRGLGGTVVWRVSFSFISGCSRVQRWGGGGMPPCACSGGACMAAGMEAGGLERVKGLRGGLMIMMGHDGIAQPAAGALPAAAHPATRPTSALPRSPLTGTVAPHGRPLRRVCLGVLPRAHVSRPPLPPPFPYAASPWPTSGPRQPPRNDRPHCPAPAGPAGPRMAESTSPPAAPPPAGPPPPAGVRAGASRAAAQRVWRLYRQVDGGWRHGGEH